MVRLLVVASALLVLSVPATASLLEDALSPVDDVLDPATGVSATYQEDGGVHGDAPDTCELATPARRTDLDGAETAGMLVDIDDESDAYVFELSADTVGDRVAVDLLGDLLVDRYDIAIDVRTPGCAESVFDPNATYYDRAPAEPYVVPDGSAGVSAGGLTGYDCGSDWKFLANQMGGIPAPETIYVEWTDGSYEYVAVDKSTPATIAMYITTSHPEVTVAKAVIVVPADYKGEFNLVHGFCDAVPGTHEPLPVLLPSKKYGEFTVQEAGTHVILVYIERGTVDKTTDLVLELVADPPTSIPVNCHVDICSLALGFTDYSVGAKNLNA